MLIMDIVLADVYIRGLEDVAEFFNLVMVIRSLIKQ